MFVFVFLRSVDGWVYQYTNVKSVHCMSACAIFTVWFWFIILLYYFHNGYAEQSTGSRDSIGDNRFVSILFWLAVECDSYRPTNTIFVWTKCKQKQKKTSKVPNGLLKISSTKWKLFFFCFVLPMITKRKAKQKHELKTNGSYNVNISHKHMSNEKKSYF